MPDPTDATATTPGAGEQLNLDPGAPARRARSARKAGKATKAAKAPAADRAPAPPPAGRGPGRPSNVDRRAAELFSQVVAPVGALVFMANRFDGFVIMSKGEQWARDMAALGAKVPAVERVIDQLIVGTVWTAVATSTAAMLGPIAANHGLIGGTVGQKLIEGTNLEMMGQAAGVDLNAMARDMMADPEKMSAMFGAMAQNGDGGNGAG